MDSTELIKSSHLNEFNPFLSPDSHKLISLIKASFVVFDDEFLIIKFYLQENPKQ